VAASGTAEKQRLEKPGPECHPRGKDDEGYCPVGQEPLLSVWQALEYYVFKKPMELLYKMEFKKSR
jgi:hypothetical protein